MSKSLKIRPSAPLIPGITEHFIEVDGYRQRYLTAGNGPPLLLIHGLLGYSISWQFNISALSKIASVYALDLLGAGFSDRPCEPDWSLASAGSRVFSFMDKLEISRADMIATSLGGAVAVRMAADTNQGGRINRLILPAPVNPWSSNGRRWSRIAGSAAMLPVLRYFCKHPGKLHRFAQSRLYGDPRRIPPGVLEAYSRAVAVPGTADYLRSVARNWNEEVEKLRSIYSNFPSIPTLLIWGGQDGAVSPQSGSILHKMIPNSEFATMSSAGHLPYEELPEEFNRIVLEFLTRTRGANGSY